MSGDPLDGLREGLNRGTLQRLVWPAGAEGCPVKVGQVFVLRSCAIEITRTQRRREKGRMVWVAWFTRYRREGRPQLLRRGAGYTTNLRGGMKAQDDPNAATLSRVDPDERSEAHRAAGEPPEPEPVPRGEVEALPSTLAASRRFAQLRLAEQRRRRLDQLAGQIKAIQKRAEREGVDIEDAQIDALEAAVAKVEGYVIEAVA